MDNRKRQRVGRFGLTVLVSVLMLAVVACGRTATPVATVAQVLQEPVPTAIAGQPISTVAPATFTVVATPARASAATPASPAATPASVGITPTSTVAPTATLLPPTATPAPVIGQPVRLKIPTIRVDAAIEYVGVTPTGEMDTPKNYSNTAWYQLGPRPGERGNAAIAGHVDSKTGKAVFWDLARLKPGDEVFVDGDDGVTRRFVVVDLASYDRNNAPLEQIFGQTSEFHLNLITCDSTSTFDRSKGSYAANVVVYTVYQP
jgi:LPXTG-site transpeptidase (sortase) family protein